MVHRSYCLFLSSIRSWLPAVLFMLLSNGVPSLAEARPGNPGGYQGTDQVTPSQDYTDETNTVLHGELDGIMECNDASLAYVKKLTYVGESDPLVIASWQQTKSMVASCLERVHAPHHTSLLLSKLAKLVGSLTFEDMPVCTAFRLSQTDIVTARHCLYKRTGETLFTDNRPLSNLFFVMAGDSDNKFHVLGVPCPDTPSTVCTIPNILSETDAEKGWTAQNDWITLKVENTNSPPPKLRFINNPAKGARVLVMGTSPTFSGENSRPYVPEFLATSEKGECVIGAVKNGCIYHGCATSAGFSGAPIVLYDQTNVDTIDIVGIQIEGVTQNNSGCPSSPTNGYGNVAILPNVKQSP